MKIKLAIILELVVIVILFLASKTDLFEPPTTYSRSRFWVLMMNTDEIQAFNSQYTVYEGKQTGSQVKALIQKLIAKAKTYTEEPALIATVKYVTSEDDNSKAKKWQESDQGGKITSNVLKSNSEGQKDYTNALSMLSKDITAKHTYFVELNTMHDDIIDDVVIYYDESKGEHNSSFAPYKGIRTGLQTKLFLKELIANAKTYKEEPDKIPSVRYITSEDDNFRAKKWQESSRGGNATSRENSAEWKRKYSKALKKLSKSIKTKQIYFIELNTDDTGLIGEVIIHYYKEEE